MTVVEDFEAGRAELLRLAYRMLGSVADAEDMVQETFLRWRQAGEPMLDRPQAWFVRTCTRLCLDRIGSAAQRRVDYPGEWLPEPLVDDGRGELDDTLSMALLRTVERLPPTERACLLLHDVLGYEFGEVAEILDLSPANCRQLAARGRKHVRSRGRREVDEEQVRRLADAFFKAVGEGDPEALLTVLADDVTFYADGGGKASAAKAPIVGAPKVARFFLAIFGEDRGLELERRWFNGAPGIVVRDEGRPVSAFQFELVDGHIAGIYVQRNPDKLGAFS